MVFFIITLIIAVLTGLVNGRFVYSNFVDKRFVTTRDVLDLGLLTGLLVECAALDSFIIPTLAAPITTIEILITFTCLLLIGFVRKLASLRLKIKAQRKYRYTHPNN